MHQFRGPSSRNDNEQLFMHHGSRQAEKSWREPRRRDTAMVVVVVALSRVGARVYATRECVSYGLSFSSGLRVSALK